MKFNNEWDKNIFLKDLQKLIATIPVPPAGRELALVKTKLDEARLWAQEIKIPVK